MKKIRMTVQGHVQGVGFRYMTKIVADQLGISGTVRNEENGSVSIEALGEQSAINSFIQKIKNSPSPMGRVTHVEIQEDPFLETGPTFKITN